MYGYPYIVPNLTSPNPNPIPINSNLTEQTLTWNACRVQVTKLVHQVTSRVAKVGVYQKRGSVTDSWIVPMAPMRTRYIAKVKVKPLPVLLYS